MPTYYFDFTNGSDGGAGTIDDPWKTTAKFRSSVIAGDTALFKRGGDWTTDTPGSSGHLEAAGDNITVGDYGSRSDAAPIIGSARGSPLSIASVVIGGVSTTVTTNASHGLATSDMVLIESVGGTATAANHYWVVTVTGATTFTVALTGSATELATGTVTREAIKGAGFFANGRSGCAVFGLEFTRLQYGVRLQGTIAGFNGVDLYANRTSQYWYSQTATATGVVYTRCTGYLTLEDGFNFTTGVTDYLCIESGGTYVGYGFDAATASNRSGAGDVFTNHAGCYGKLVDCFGGWAITGFVTHVNTSGVSRAINCRAWECAENTYHQNTGGTLVCVGCVGWAPDTITLSSSSPRGVFAVKTSGVLYVLNCTVYTSKGVQATPSGSCYGFTGRDAGSTLYVRNLRVVSNGSAPMGYVSGPPGTLNINYNAYSHNGTLWTSSGSKTFTTWQALGHDANSVATGIGIRTEPPTANVPADFHILADDGAQATGEDQSALFASLGVTEALLDPDGIVRGFRGGWAVGAYEQRPVASAFSRARRAGA